MKVTHNKGRLMWSSEEEGESKEQEKYWPISTKQWGCSSKQQEHFDGAQTHESGALPTEPYSPSLFVFSICTLFCTLQSRVCCSRPSKVRHKYRSPLTLTLVYKVSGSCLELVNYHIRQHMISDYFSILIKFYIFLVEAIFKAFSFPFLPTSYKKSTWE